MSLDTAKLRIVQYPDEILRVRTRPIEKIDDTVRAVAARMIELMREVNGAGLAAPQVGLDWRLFVVASQQEGVPDQAYINPEVKPMTRELVTHEEGCLSLPGIAADIRRPKAATLTATTLDGDQVTLSDEDFLARVWQHEQDHLEGVLIIDRMSTMDRLATRKALKEMRLAAGK